jgi:hypothetical protein
VASQPVFDQSAWAKATVEERLLAEYMAKRGIVQKLVPPPQARKTKGQTRDENEPRSDGGKDGASVPAAQPEPGWKMSASLAREIASAFGDYRNGDLDGDLLQKVSGNAYSEMEKRYPDEARHSPEALVRSIVGTFGRVVGAYERGEATHLRPYLRSALWKNIESGWRLLEYEPWRFEGADGRVHGDEDRHGSVADAVAAEIEAFEDGQITAAHERQAS